MFDIYTLVEALWLIIPAYAANGLVPVVRKFGKTHPIDGGRKFIDNRPLLGPGKSWEGLILACVVGALIGTFLMFVQPLLPWDLSPVQLDIVPMSPVLGLLLGLGAMIFDSIGSFIKRRLKLKRGQIAPLLDQEDFLIGSLLFASLLVSIKLDWWIWLLVITPIIHLPASVVAYWLKVKREPW